MEKNDFEAKTKYANTVFVVSEYNGLSISLVEKLLANFYRVKVFCVYKHLWINKASYLKDNNFLTIHEIKDLKGIGDYLIFVSSFFDNLGGKTEKQSIEIESLRLLNSLYFKGINKKKFFILPYSVFEKLGKEMVSLYSLNIKNEDSVLKNFVIYLDDLVGPRLILNNRDEISICLRSLINGNKVVLPNLPSTTVSPTPVGEASRKIVEILDKEDVVFRTLICGRKMLLKNWTQILKVGFENFDYAFLDKKTTKISGIVDGEIYLDKEVDLKFLRQTLNWFRNNMDGFYFEENALLDLKTAVLEGKEELEEEKIIKKKNGVVEKSFPGVFLIEKIYSLKNKLQELFKRRKIRLLSEKIANKKTFNFRVKVSLENVKFPKIGIETKKYLVLQRCLLFVFSTLVTLVLVPTISLVFSFIFFYFGQTAIKKAYFDQAKYFFVFQGKTADFSMSQFYFYSNISFLGKYFGYFGQLADISSQIADVAGISIDVGQKTFSLIEKTVNGQEFPLDVYSREIVLSLDVIYQKLSFLDGELNEVKDVWPFSYFSYYIDKADLERRREEIQAARSAFSLIGRVLGEDREKNYLVLLQNNMELRPTGGFIGSFAIVGFKRGAMTKFEIYDVYSADGQLKGYVEPPWQLKKYLDQPAWYLRDSNWDPDFVVSSKKAEWFLDKSMNIQVDGVIGIDLYFVQDLVDVFGSVYVSDFDKAIDAKNFYEVVQYEAEKDFFPGSRQKQNFLLALSKSLLSNFKSATKFQLLGLLTNTYRNLNERHVQLFLHEAQIQEKIDNLGWSGVVEFPFCSSENCFSDGVSLVEANLGVNKANYFIDREARMKVKITDKSIYHRLEIVFVNNAQTFMGDKAIYKNYLRLVLPGDAEINSVKAGRLDNLEDINFDQDMLRGNREMGLFLEVLPSETKKVVFEWSKDRGLNLDKNGEYKFYFRKQAGIKSLPFSLEVDFPDSFFVGNDLQLTKGNKFIYNQPDLRKDFLNRFYW